MNRLLLPANASSASEAISSWHESITELHIAIAHWTVSNLSFILDTGGQNRMAAVIVNHTLWSPVQQWADGPTRNSTCDSNRIKRISRYRHCVYTNAGTSHVRTDKYVNYTSTQCSFCRQDYRYRLSHSRLSYACFTVVSHHSSMQTCETVLYSVVRKLWLSISNRRTTHDLNVTVAREAARQSSSQS